MLSDILYQVSKPNPPTDPPSIDVLTHPLQNGRGPTSSSPVASTQPQANPSPSIHPPTHPPTYL